MENRQKNTHGAHIISLQSTRLKQIDIEVIFFQNCNAIFIEISNSWVIHKLSEQLFITFIKSFEKKVFWLIVLRKSKLHQYHNVRYTCCKHLNDFIQEKKSGCASITHQCKLYREKYFHLRLTTCLTEPSKLRLMKKNRWAVIWNGWWCICMFNSCTTSFNVPKCSDKIRCTFARIMLTCWNHKNTHVCPRYL